MKITIENQAFLRRLQEKQPTYSVSQWNKDFAKAQELKMKIMEQPMWRENPFVIEQDENQLPNMQSRSLSGYGSVGTQSAGLLGRPKRGLQSAKPLGQASQPLVRQAENLDENRIVLYKRSKQLGQGYFVVEISSNNTHLFIAAHDVESPESLLIELPEKRAQEILKEFNNDYEKMACSLQVMNKRLVLLNPVSFGVFFNRCRNLFRKRTRTTKMAKTAKNEI